MYKAMVHLSSCFSINFTWVVSGYILNDLMCYLHILLLTKKKFSSLLRDLNVTSSVRITNFYPFAQIMHGRPFLQRKSHLRRIGRASRRVHSRWSRPYSLPRYIYTVLGGQPYSVIKGLNLLNPVPEWAALWGRGG
jgi:hypothetical protein